MERGTLYPAWVYHQTEAPRIVNSAAEDDALGPDWSNTPATFAEFSPKEPVSAENSVENGLSSEKADVVPTTDGVGSPKKRGRKPKA